MAVGAQLPRRRAAQVRAATEERAAEPRPAGGEPTTVVQRHDDAAMFEADWEALCRRLHRPPQDWPAWQRCHAQAFGRGQTGYLTAHRDGRLVGVLPYERRRDAVAVPAARPHSPAGQPVAEDEEARVALLRALGRERPRTLLWHEWRPDDWSATLVREALLPELPRQRPGQVVSSPHVDLTRPWDALTAAWSRNYRKDLRRRRRRAEGAWTVRHEVRRGTEVSADLLERCFAIEASGWKGTEGTAIANLPHLRRFYTDVAGWAATTGWLRLDLLWFDDALAAFQFGLQHDGVLWSLKVGYEQAHAACSPGSLLDLEVMRDGVEDPTLQRLELGAGESRAKLQWATGSHALHELRAFPGGVSGAVRDRADRARQQARRQAAERLSPAAVARVRTVRGRTRQLLARARTGRTA